MMLKSQLKLSLAGVFVMACVAWLGFANGHPTGEQELQVLEYKDDKFTFRAPVAMKGKIDGTRKEAQCQAMKNVVSSLEPVVENIFEGRLLIRSARKLFTLGNDVKKMMSESKKLRDKDKTGVVAPDGHAKEMAEFVASIAKVNRQAEELSTEDAKERVTHIFQAINGLCDQSPVGLSLNWPLITVNDEKFLDFIQPIILYLKKEGYDSALTILNTVSGLIKRFQG